MAVAAVPPLLSQVPPPTITAVLGINNSTNVPVAVGAAITAGTPGNFQLEVDLQSAISGVLQDVLWQNPTYPNLSATFPANSIQTSTSCRNAAPQCLFMTVPSSLYPLSAGPSTVNIKVEVTSGGTVLQSNTKTFAINAPLRSLSPRVVVVGDTITFDLYGGGTTPVSNALNTLTGAPPWLSVPSQNPTVSGTPTATGTFTLSMGVVDAWGNAATIADVIQVVNPPTITLLSPNPARAGSPDLQLIVNGTNFVASDAVNRGSTVATCGDGCFNFQTTFNSSTQLTATIPANQLTNPGSIPLTVLLPSQTPCSQAGLPTSNQCLATLNVATAQPLLITSGFPPNGTAGVAYSFGPIAAGGFPPYTWSATGLPGGLSINPSTGQISGVPQIPGPASIALTVTDSSRASLTSNYSFTIIAGVAPLQIFSQSLPNGVVGSAYTALIGARGGVEPYVFSASGTLPSGVSLTAAGLLNGVPDTAGTYTFSIRVQGADGQTDTRTYTVVITAPPLSITTASPLTDAPLGTPLTVTFAATGGVTPYVFTASGSLPPGTSFANGVLSGTPTQAGAFQFQVTVTDKAGSAESKTFSINVVVRTLTITTTSPLPDGQVGVAYSAQFAGSGGVPPYSWTATGIPQGLAFSAAGVLSGTPTADGSFSLSVTLSDSGGKTASGSFGLLITPAKLVITTASLPDGTVGVAYSASLAASGGVKPYTWSITGLPAGLSADATGVISGTPPAQAAGQSMVSAAVTDAKGAKANQTFALNIVLAPLQITANLPTGTVGTGYSGSFSASGGVAPYTWSGNGLPAGLSLAADGTVSGTPQAGGTSSAAVTVKDSRGTTANGTFPITIGLPAGPGVNITGIQDTSNPGTQPALQIALAASYPTDVTVALTLTFAPDSGPDDPNIQFSTGGRITRITVPAGSTANVGNVGVQTGTVAGVITITAQLQAANQDVTPRPAPVRTIRINATPPVLTTVTATRTSAGFTVTVIGFAPTRELAQATFQLTAAPGSNLQTTAIPIAVDPLFTAWWQNPDSIQFGSQFKFVQNFTVQGDTNAIASVSVTLSNKAGASAAVSATLQ